MPCRCFLIPARRQRSLLDANTASRLGLGLGAVDSGDQQYPVPCQYANTNASISYGCGGADGVTITVPVSELIGDQDGNQCASGIAPFLDGSAILGDIFLRSAYIVLDMDNNMAALAQAVHDRVEAFSIAAISSGISIPSVSITAIASGTMLEGAAALATGSVPVVSSQHNSYSIGTPTFSLGSAATLGVSNAATSVSSRQSTWLLLLSALAGSTARVVV